MLEISSVTLRTDAMDRLDYDDAQVIGYRLLELPFVESVDWMHGIIEITCYEIALLKEKMAILKRHIAAPIAAGEWVEEIFHEYGNTVYTYRYHQGSYGRIEPPLYTMHQRMPCGELIVMGLWDDTPEGWRTCSKRFSGSVMSHQERCETCADLDIGEDCTVSFGDGAELVYAEYAEKEFGDA